MRPGDLLQVSSLDEPVFSGPWSTSPWGSCVNPFREGTYNSLPMRPTGLLLLFLASGGGESDYQQMASPYLPISP